MSGGRIVAGAVLSVLSAPFMGACSSPSTSSLPAGVKQLVTQSSQERVDAFRRAAVWKPTPIETMDIRQGPSGRGAFPWQATVRCHYVERPLRGHSLKFACAGRNDDVMRVKVGKTNGEVYGEVAATRLLWALGFGADRMYPVKVICRGCPSRFGGEPSADDEQSFDPAVIERSMPGAEFDDEPGWAGPELALVDENAGGAPRAHRDALKLLAVFLQHTDSKTEQQRLLCIDEPGRKHPQRCREPFLMLDDVGLTFGGANFINNNALGGVNFERWSGVAVWLDTPGCIGNLPRSFSGTLGYPRISDEGRVFLAGLLRRLSQRQIRDLFEVSRFEQRGAAGGAAGGATVAEWVAAFNAKRNAIEQRHCL